MYMPTRLFIVVVTIAATMMLAVVIGAMTYEIRPITVVCIGDSLTEGSPACHRDPEMARWRGEYDETSSYTYWMQQSLPGVVIVNRGIGGDTTGGCVWRFDRDVLAECPDYVVIWAGVNDTFRTFPVCTITKNLTIMYEKARKNNIHVIAVLVPPYEYWNESARNDARTVNAFIANYGKTHDRITVVDLHDTPLMEREGVIKTQYTPDRLHCTPEGYRIVGETIAQTIKR